MTLRWFGHSAFLLSGERRVFIDPFGPMDGLADRGLTFDYPAIGDVEADLLLVTHEHRDHNAVEAVGGSPQVIRCLAGTFDTPVGEVVGVASEHDERAGTQRGANVMFRFALGGLRIAHLGDLGQAALRPDQAAALGDLDVLMIPVGAGPTIGGDGAARVVRALRPRLVVPMHHRTPAVNFLEPPDAFLEALGADVHRVATSETDLAEHLGSHEAPVVLLMAAPLR
jgi:L-ascorbate metabolism protein UlaG (beta-lactamase superfamily)